MHAALPLLAAAALAAAPPARLTPEQARLLQEAGAHAARARADRSAGRHADALARLADAHDARRRALGPWHVVTIRTLEALADWSEERGLYREAAGHSLAAFEARKRLHGARHWQTAEARLRYEDARAQITRSPADRAKLREAAGHADRAAELASSVGPALALPAAQRAAALYREVVGASHRLTAISLSNEAYLLDLLGRQSAALPLFREAERGLRASLGAGHPTHATSLNNLAHVLQGVGDYAGALPLYREALASLLASGGERHPEYATTLLNLGSLYRAQGRQRVALPMARRALALRAATHGERSQEYATALNALALLLQELGDPRGSLPLYEKALAILSGSSGIRAGELGTAYNNLAAVQQELGDHRAALGNYRRALTAHKDSLGERHPEYSVALQNLAGLYAMIGDHESALPLLRQAMKIRRDTLGERHPSYAAALNDLGLLLRATGDLRAAAETHEQALALTRRTGGVRHPDYATSLSNLGLTLLQLGAREEALGHLNKAHALVKEQLGERHPAFSAGLTGLSAAHRAAGDLRAAVAYARKAAELDRELLGERHPTYASTLQNLAILLEELGEPEAALPIAERSLALSSAYLNDAALALSDRQQFEAARALRYRLDGRLCLTGGDPYPHVLAWKGAILLRQRARRLASAVTSDPKAVDALERLRAATREMSARAGHAPDRLAELAAEHERAQAELARLSGAARPGRASPEALAAVLPEGVALIDYLIYLRTDIRGRDGSPRDVRHLAAFVTRKGRAGVRFDLGPAERVEDELRDWRKELAAGGMGIAAGARVKALAWSPLAVALRGAGVVLVAPDGPLGAAPFAALPGAKEGTFLIEDIALASVPVPQALPELLAPVAKGGRLPPSLLVVGDVDYEGGAEAPEAGTDERSAPAGVRRAWARLPATFSEAASATRSFKGLFKGGSVIDLAKGEATKKAVREALGKVRYAHLATHGFFAPEAMYGELAVSRGAPGPAGGHHPFLLSGLALSGANREPKEGEEDGILTALEISEMLLPRLELVVLSACETGLGKEAGGEGLLGLQRAFVMAGARSVVASLWPVDDAATQLLMSELYRVAWDTKKIVSRAEALRQAQLHLLRNGVRRGAVAELVAEKRTRRAPPYYWAGFVLSGDWR